jgi:hypothetical protein
VITLEKGEEALGKELSEVKISSVTTQILHFLLLTGRNYKEITLRTVEM